MVIFDAAMNGIFKIPFSNYCWHIKIVFSYPLCDHRTYQLIYEFCGIFRILKTYASESHVHRTVLIFSTWNTFHFFFSVGFTDEGQWSGVERHWADVQVWGLLEGKAFLSFLLSTILYQLWDPNLPRIFLMNKLLNLIKCFLHVYWDNHGFSLVLC